MSDRCNPATVRCAHLSFPSASAWPLSFCVHSAQTSTTSAPPTRSQWGGQGSVVCRCLICPDLAASRYLLRIAGVALCVCAAPQRNIYYNQNPKKNTPTPNSANTIYVPDTMESVSKVESPCESQPRFPSRARPIPRTAHAWRAAGFHCLSCSHRATPLRSIARRCLNSPRCR